MRVIPVLDLRGGIAVHATGGHRREYVAVRSRLLDDAPHTDGDPVALALAYRLLTGHRELYLADLDAIVDGQVQWACLHALAADGARVWVDAGVTDVRRGREIAALPVARVIVGLETLRCAEALAELCAELGGERVAFSLDLRAGAPVTVGSAFAGRSPQALVEMAVAAGACSVIALDLARVGTGSGVDVALLRSLRAIAPAVDLIAGGGVGRREDLLALATAGVDGVLVASALHDGRLSARDLRSVARPE